MSVFDNPFDGDADRGEIWEILVRRDLEAFLSADWDATKGDFVEEGFFGIDGQNKNNPDQWVMTFPDLASYRDVWLQAATASAAESDRRAVREPLYAASRLKSIDINGSHAIAHKEIKGAVPKRDGSREILDWQTLYVMRKEDGRWKIASFVGYLPSVMGADGVAPVTAPPAQQHVTAGPYSPVLKVNAEELVVISGQCAIDMSGNIVGETFEEQTRYTLENCARQLTNAGCGLEDVFKVNVYLPDLGDWERFNEIYVDYMRKPYPVRTAIQAGLLPGLLVEIEMWAAKR
ncbi:RidA family protein [Microbulbifer magnicolonia]|uniref:RidA family protein n=1 Tax=Microbulbifer magnicolonia TaxID=3109744 RepID=UPI002B401735|nr:RidA family protein [Microbulbifer sp. GG15]